MMCGLSLFLGQDSNHAGAENSEDEREEKPKFIVNEPEAKEQLTRKIIEHDQKQRGHLQQKKVLPLLKPRHQHRHKKHGNRSNHGLRKTGHDENWHVFREKVTLEKCPSTTNTAANNIVKIYKVFLL